MNIISRLLPEPMTIETSSRLRPSTPHSSSEGNVMSLMKAFWSGPLRKRFVRTVFVLLSILVGVQSTLGLTSHLDFVPASQTELIGLSLSPRRGYERR